MGVLMSASVSDLLAFDALPEETRKMVERVYEDKLADEYERGQEEAEGDDDEIPDEAAIRQEGYDEGYQAGIKVGIERASQQKASNA